MKRVLFLADGLGSGGAERQMVTIARELKKRGYDVYVLCYSSGDFNAHLLLNDAIPIIWKVESRALPRMIKVRRYIRGHRFDAVVSFLETPNFLNNFSAIGPHNWKVITGERSSKDSTFLSKKSKVYLKFQRFADTIVCNSENAQLKWIKNVPQYEGKLKTIYNSVTLGTVDNEYIIRKNGKLNVLVAASHQYLKNAMGVARAISLLSEEEKRQIHIDWYGAKSVSGDGSKAYDEVCEFVEMKNIQDCISFHSPSKDIANLMNQADVVSLFSRLEGLPNTICEGMTIGKPIIMTRVSDFNTLLVDGENGFLCDWDDASSIKDAFSKAIQLSDEQIVQMGKCSREKANHLFSAKTIMSQWESIIE